MDESTLRRSMLFDFYGKLLTEKQREYYDLHFNEDFSLGEIAEQAGISRQGVWDIIRRADKILYDTEENTGLIRRFEQLRQEVSVIEERVLKIRELSGDEGAKLADEVLDRLQNLKN